MRMRIWLATLLLATFSQGAEAQNTKKPLPKTPVETLQEFVYWRPIISKCRNNYDSSGAYRVAQSTIEGATDACGWLDEQVTKKTDACKEKLNIAKQKAGPLIEVLKTKINQPRSTSLTEDQTKQACLEAVALASQEVTGGASAAANPTDESMGRRTSAPDTTFSGKKAKVPILMGSKRRNTK